MKNMKVIFAKKYTMNFYEILSLKMSNKDFKELKKNVKKFEDVGYIKKVLNDDIKKAIIDKYNTNKDKNITRYQDLIKKLENLYIAYFADKEIIDVPAIKKVVSEINSQLLNCTTFEYLHDINLLFDFSNNINVELNVYISKHKSEEYMDMTAFRLRVSGMIKEVKDVLEYLIQDNQINDDEYYEKYITYLYEQFNVVFENASGKTNSLPNWAKGLLFCSPWILGFLVFTVYPLIQTLIFSFSNVTLTTSGFQTSWAGFNNYSNVIKDTDVIKVFKNYLIEMLVYVPLITIFSLILAMLLNSKIKTKGLFRTIFFFPVIITSGPVIKKLIENGATAMPGIKTIFDVQTITAGMPELVGTAFTILTSDFIMILWYSGIQILVFLTGLQKIDKGVYEASAIDGANKWEQFWKVTLPAINPTIVINVVFTVIMQSIFALNPIIIKIQEDSNKTTEGYGYGYSSALAFTYFIVMLLVLVIFVVIFKKHERKNKEGR